MAELPLDLPPGIHANGTQRARKGRWIDGSRVRWHNNAIRPIGGWSPFGTNEGPLNQVIPDPTTEVSRAALSYKLNDGSGMFVAATNLGLRAWYRGSVVVHNITPIDFSPRPRETAAATGYGQWFYGVDSYGTERQGDTLDLPDTFTWALRTWGQNLLAAPKGAPSQLYEWAPTFTTRAVPVDNAPIDFDCFHVTDQRMVMVAGDPVNPRLVQWCSSEDNTDWNFTNPLNTAGFITLPGVGRFKSIVTVQDKVLLVGEADAFIARYLGPPYVYGFESAGENCGTIAPSGVVSTDEFAMWPGMNGFFMYDGSVVRPVQCDVMDQFRRTVNATQISKTVGFVNPGWQEIWWLYQSGDEDVDSYIFYNWATNYWAIGKLDRTVAGGNGAIGGLFMLGVDGFAYNHEIEGVAPVDVAMSEVYLESAPIEMGGPQYFNYIVPDFDGTGSLSITLKGQDRPNGPETTFGPYIIEYPAAAAQPVPCRARGKLMKVRIEGISALWTMGQMSLHSAQADAQTRRK